ncbi:hypothetical protein U91I_00470 [alpha proteobacterium U9-1i]|nr:hypothetical protein U91I_00470 [alpha proteobacterium U9-1i]
MSREQSDAAQISPVSPTIATDHFCFEEHATVWSGRPRPRVMTLIALRISLP